MLLTVLTVVVKSSQCVVLFSVLIMLIVLDYVALNVLAVNVAFVVGLMEFYYAYCTIIFSMFFIM